ncbi:MAG: NADH-quinone oxidoreductase subunit N [Dehalococcoidia bacterium]|nr:NADH-quinone oxidoreductase subunit N [Dehalococcoidia bacterium]
MSWREVSLILPEVGVIGLGVLMVLADLVLPRKGWLVVLAVAGLMVLGGITIGAWVGGEAETAFFGTLRVDQFSHFFRILILGIVALVILASVDYVSHFERFQGEYYGLLLFSAGGMMFLASASELISIYLALELTTLPLAALAAFLRGDRSTEAGIKLLLLSALSSALLLYGMVLIYGFTGTTHLGAIATAVQGVAGEGLRSGGYPLLLGMVLLVAGFGFKVSAVPFQMWVPDVYQGAPTPITAYLSVASKAAGFAVLLRVFYVAFGQFDVNWGGIFAVLSVLSMTVGNLAAVAQRDIKRMLAYSTIAHGGYLLVGVAAIASGAPGPTGPTGVLFYLGAYALTNLAAFFVVIAASRSLGSDQIQEYAGLARRAPLLAACLAFALVSLTGIPPTAGFMAKVFIFGAAVNSGLVWLAVAGVVNSVLSAYYYMRVIRAMYFAPPSSNERVPSSLAFRIALGVSTVGVLALGLAPGPLMDVADQAASLLRAGG